MYYVKLKDIKPGAIGFYMDSVGKLNNFANILVEVIAVDSNISEYPLLVHKIGSPPKETIVLSIKEFVFAANVI